MVTVSVRRRPCSSRARVSAPGMTIVALSALPRTHSAALHLELVHNGEDVGWKNMHIQDSLPTGSNSHAIKASG